MSGTCVIRADFTGSTLDIPYASEVMQSFARLMKIDVVRSGSTFCFYVPADMEKEILEEMRKRGAQYDEENEVTYFPFYEAHW